VCLNGAARAAPKTPGYVNAQCHAARRLHTPRRGSHIRRGRRGVHLPRSQPRSHRARRGERSSLTSVDLTPASVRYSVATPVIIENLGSLGVCAREESHLRGRARGSSPSSLPQEPQLPFDPQLFSSTRVGVTSPSFRCRRGYQVGSPAGRSGGPADEALNALPDDLRNPVQNPVCLTTSRFLPTTTATSSPQQADSANPAQSVGVFLGRIAHHASIGMGGLS
jgi:hypothetical protein